MSGGVCLCTVPQNRLTKTGFFLLFLFLSQTSLTLPRKHMWIPNSLFPRLPSTKALIEY